MSKKNFNPDIKAIQEIIDFVHPDNHDSDRMSASQITYATQVAEAASSALENLMEAMPYYERWAKEKFANELIHS